jgi:uncharacterized membrane protein required for colicin V production
MFWLDTTILVLIGLGTVLGIVSGFLWQVARILSLVLSLYASILLNDWVVGQCREMLLRDADPRLIQILAYVFVFMAVYFVLYQFVWVCDRFIRTVRLQPVDRFLGALVGGCKMALLLAGVSLGLAHYPTATTQEVMEKSALAPVLAGAMEMVIAVIPQEYKTELCNGLAELKAMARARVEQKERAR